MADSKSLLGLILLPFADVLAFISTRNVSSFFPYPWASTIHAARTSIAYQMNVKKTSSHHIPWATYIAGYLVMSFGGGFISNVLMSTPPPQLYSIHPYINYTAVHLLLTALFKFQPGLHNTQILDTILFPLDAAVRVNSITATLNGLAKSQANPLLTLSPVFHIIIGAVASAGGGVTAGTLSTWTPNWSLGTPVFLRNGAGFYGSLDVWAGSLIAVIYSTLTGHPAFAPLNEAVKTYVDFQPLSPLGAKAFAALVLSALFGARVYSNHWAGVTPAAVQSGKKKNATESEKSSAKTR
ncbi:hypothetical protein DL96DRAFT_1616846 [Flagelloscypha sp. PMI_526]|nr:hypothetical protein DL96DRAFT_1616846 [Flagelloscypha sp. PMI_526]